MSAATGKLADDNDEPTTTEAADAAAAAAAADGSEGDDDDPLGKRRFFPRVKHLITNKEWEEVSQTQNLLGGFCSGYCFFLIITRGFSSLFLCYVESLR